MTAGRGLLSHAALALVGAMALVAPASASMATATVGASPSVWAPSVDERPAVGAGALAVRITDLAPAIPVAGDTLTVTGTITNVSDAVVTDVAATLRVSPTPLPSRGEIAEILLGGGQRIGDPVPGVRDVVAPRLPPQSSVTFSLQAAVDSLGLSDAGAYMAGVQAEGSTGGGVVRQDLDRTFLPWWPEGTTAEPISVVTLWPVTSVPQQDAAGVLLSELPAVDMSPAGRLSTLVEAAADRPGVVSLVLDPATVAAAAEMSDGYEVRTEEGTEPGSRAMEVSRWLDELRSVVADPEASVSATFYALPDLVAARRGALLSGLLAMQATADAAVTEALGRPVSADVALLPDGVITQPTLNRLARDGVRVVVLSERAVEPPGTYFTPSGTIDLPTRTGDQAAVVTDAGLDATLRMPLSDRADQTAARQRLLAETLVTITELPLAPRLLATAPDPTWSPPTRGATMITDTLATAPWIRPTTLAEALLRGPSDIDRTLRPYGPEERAGELTAQHVGQVRDEIRVMTEYERILTDPAELPGVARSAPNRGLSSWFRDDPVAGAGLVDTVSTQFAASLVSVRVVSSGSISVSGASGTIPITVENAGPAQVTVGIRMSTDPPQLFTAEPIDPFPIDPGQRTSLEVQAQVAAAGPVPVSVQLTDAEGESFGVPGELTVSSSAYANAARVLIRGSLVALILAVTVHGVRRARRLRRARTRTDAEDVEGSADRSEVAHG